MDLGIGDTLRDARRRNGTTLADAAADTRVRESYLAALEQEEFASLGSDVYVRGFITSYARFLELDPAPLIAAYRSAIPPAPEVRDPARSARAARASRQARASVYRSSRRRRQPLDPRLAIAGGLLIILLLVLLLFRGGGGDEVAGAVTALGAALAVRP